MKRSVEEIYELLTLGTVPHSAEKIPPRHPWQPSKLDIATGRLRTGVELLKMWSLCGRHGICPESLKAQTEQFLKENGV